MLTTARHHHLALVRGRGPEANTLRDRSRCRDEVGAGAGEARGERRSSSVAGLVGRAAIGPPCGQRSKGDQHGGGEADQAGHGGFVLGGGRNYAPLAGTKHTLYHTVGEDSLPRDAGTARNSFWTRRWDQDRQPPTMGAEIARS